MPRYQPTDALQSPRFCGVRTFARLPFVTAVEVLPAYDPTQITALLAANIAYEMLSLIADRRKLRTL